MIESVSLRLGIFQSKPCQPCPVGTDRYSFIKYASALPVATLQISGKHEPPRGHPGVSDAMNVVHHRQVGGELGGSSAIFVRTTEEIEHGPPIQRVQDDAVVGIVRSGGCEEARRV